LGASHLRVGVPIKGEVFGRLFPSFDLISNAFRPFEVFALLKRGRVHLIFGL